MIHINLLPGSGKKSRSKGSSLPSFGSLMSGFAEKVKDPFLIGAAAAVLVSLTSVGALYGWQTARERTLVDREQRAVQDSTKFAQILRDKAKAESQRDSVLRQLSIIKSIDNNRYVWSHLMDEVSRALPPYTWLTTIVQTSQSKSAAAKPVEANTGKKKSNAPADTATKSKKPAPIPVDTLKFQIIGNTVDIQALTRYMRMLEASPFIQNVALAQSMLIVEGGKEVTQFHLDAEYQTPDSSAIRTVPIAVSVR
jgi:Tfp pilus assembly protein PilN